MSGEFTRYVRPLTLASCLALGAVSGTAAHADASPTAPGERKPASEPPENASAFVGRTCDAIEHEARRRALPPAFFARLIWTESRFNPSAVSPKGASGIAQFMPETARERGLADPFDPGPALAAAAAYLQELKYQLGNLGLAAAGYNAGPDRVTRWQEGTSFLPSETQQFVLRITGLAAADWTAAEVETPDFSLHPELPFDEACREFASLARPMPRGTAIAVTETLKPWGVLITSHFSETLVMESLDRLRRAYSVVAEHEPIDIARRPNRARGGRIMYEVMLGVDDRAAGNALCDRMHREGGACMVVRN